jgi:hypothetical protein
MILLCRNSIREHCAQGDQVIARRSQWRQPEIVPVQVPE